MGRRRAWVVTAVLLGLIAVLVAASLAVGAYTLTLPELLATLVGLGEGKSPFVVFQLRMPRLVMALVAGIGFAIAGGLFQSVLRNPLASPDIIGITGGASVGAVAAVLGWGLSGFAVSAAAFVGAMVVASAIYLLSRGSGVTGNRFVLVGVGFAFMVSGALGFMLTRSDVRDAQAALVWMVGSLNGTRWADIAVAASCLVVLVALVAVLSRRMRLLELGPGAATALGVPAGRSTMLLLAVAVACAATATAAVGPLAFVALVAAPIARRAVGRGAVALVPTALVGALLVGAADFISQHLLPGGTAVPAGVVTGAVGAPYLLWLLATSRNKS